MPTSTESFVYLLVNRTSSTRKASTTYVGATVDLDRRLRQHNKEIKGGAKATGRREAWTRVAYVAGFPTWQAALQFEWRWKQLTRKYAPPGPQIQRRMHALNHLLSLERSTSKAIPFVDWPLHPRVVIEDDDAVRLCPPGLEDTIV